MNKTHPFRSDFSLPAASSETNNSDSCWPSFILLAHKTGKGSKCESQFENVRDEAEIHGKDPHRQGVTLLLPIPVCLSFPERPRTRHHCCWSTIQNFHPPSHILFCSRHFSRENSCQAESEWAGVTTLSPPCLVSSIQSNTSNDQAMPSRIGVAEMKEIDFNFAPLHKHQLH